MRSHTDVFNVVLPMTVVLVFTGNDIHTQDNKDPEKHSIEGTEMAQQAAAMYANEDICPACDATCWFECPCLCHEGCAEETEDEGWHSPVRAKVIRFFTIVVLFLLTHAFLTSMTTLSVMKSLLPVYSQPQKSRALRLHHKENKRVLASVSVKGLTLMMTPIKRRATMQRYVS